MTQSAEQRFRAFLAELPNGCWQWTGYVAPNGYGSFKCEGKNRLAHRWAYETFVRPIPEGLVIDHLCRNRACVNPAHLDVVTQSQNAMRGMLPSAVIKRQKVCKSGHALIGANVYVPPKKPAEQTCRECRKRRSAEYRKRRSAA